MGEDRLEQLLRQADAAAGVPAGGPGDLAGRVRRQARRRHVTRVAGTAVAAGMVLIVGVTIALRTAQPEPSASPSEQMIAERPPDPEELDRLRAEISQLRSELDEALALTRELAARQRQERTLARLRRELARPDPIEQVRQQVDKAAFIIVYQADRMYRELNLTESAADSYRRAMALFPDSRWADVARDRLAEIEQVKGDPL